MILQFFLLTAGFCVVKGDVVLSPSPALAAEGESFKLTCTYRGDSEVYGFSWLLRGNIIAVLLLPDCTPFDNPGPPNSSLYEYACLSNIQCSFTVKQISNSNNGDNWQCAASAPGYIYSYNVTVTVQVSVTNVSLTPPGSIRENIETTFTCETSASRPSANITWYKESTNGQTLAITNEASSSTIQDGDLVKTKSVLKFTPKRNENGSKIYCQALNIQGRKPVISTKFNMDVQYAPDSAPIIQGFSNGSNYYIIENNQGQLSCTSNGGNPLAILTWTCFNDGSPSFTRGTTVAKNVTWNATRSSDRPCFCHSSHPVAETQSVSVLVEVLYKPDSPGFKVKDINVSGTINFIRGNINSIVCESHGKPEPDKYSWSKEGINTSTGNTLKLNPVRIQDNGQYTCTAGNTMTPSRGDPQTGSNSSKVKINVLYAPKIAQLDKIDIIAGRNLNFQCPVIDGNPASTMFKWTRDGDSISWNTQTLDLKNVTKNDDMMYTCTVKNEMRPTGSSLEIGTDSKSFHLNVLYMASVKSFYVRGQQSSQSSITIDEKANVQFICTVDSNPGSSIEIQFLDRTAQREENTRNLTYNHKNVSCLDAGVYTCSASNKYNVMKSSEKKLILFVKCFPRPLIQVKENVTSALRVQSSLIFMGIAYPKPIFRWQRKEGNIWKPLTNNSHLSISTSGVDSNLTINNVSQSDYGEYQLIIENEVDVFIQNYTLIPEGVPETPSEFQVIDEHISDTSVLLQWKPGFDGGPQQTFILLYKKTSDKDWINKTVEDNKNDLINYTLNDLASGSEYQVVIFSRNRVGDSLGYKNITFMTIVQENESSNGNFAIVGAAAGGGAGLVLILFTVGFFILRQKGFLTKGKAYKEEEFNDRKPVHTDEDDYGMQDNPMYVSAGPKDRIDEASGSSNVLVYSTVNKARNKSDSDRNDVYAEVDKSKKMKTKKGNKETKEKKGFLKDKRNSKDVYENATTTELKDTITKQRKNDEVIYENPEPSKTAVRKNVNTDGLIYADLTFNDQPKGQKKLVIHGLDDMTEYVEVDFTKKAEPLPDSDDENNPTK